MNTALTSCLLLSGCKDESDSPAITGKLWCEVSLENDTIIVSEFEKKQNFDCDGEYLNQTDHFRGSQDL